MGNQIASSVHQQEIILQTEQIEPAIITHSAQQNNFCSTSYSQRGQIILANEGIFRFRESSKCICRASIFVRLVRVSVRRRVRIITFDVNYRFKNRETPLDIESRRGSESEL